jgi:hypothetical protein
VNAQHIVRKTILRFKKDALSRAFEAWLLYEPSLIAYAPMQKLSDQNVAQESIDDDDNSFMSIFQKKLSATIETTKEFASQGYEIASSAASTTIETTKEFASQGYEVASAAASASVDIVSSTVHLIVPQSLSPSAPLQPRHTPRSFASSPAEPRASSPSPHAPISPSPHAMATAATRPPALTDRLGDRASHLRVEVKSLRDIR